METERSDPGGFVIPRLEAPPPADLIDPVIEAYKGGVDRTLLRENLSLSVEERIRKIQDFMEFLDGVRSAGREKEGRPESGR
jgi:hypothetical protein